MLQRLTCLAVCLAAIVMGADARAAENVTIYAAASTTGAIQEIAAQYKEETGVEVTPVFAASGSLARQIDNGANADLFLSADSDWIEWLAKRSRVDRRRVVPLLSNCLVLIEPAGETPPLAFDATLVKRLGDGRLAMADPALAPLGAYARAALRAEGLWHRLRNRLAIQPNARATVALVARGEATAGIVYQSDAQGNERVRVAARIPARLYPRIVYPIVPVGRVATTPAMLFLDYLHSTSAYLVFERHGFIEPEATCPR